MADEVRRSMLYVVAWSKEGARREVAAAHLGSLTLIG